MILIGVQEWTIVEAVNFKRDMSRLYGTECGIVR